MVRFILTESIISLAKMVQHIDGTSGAERGSSADPTLRDYCPNLYIVQIKTDSLKTLPNAVVLQYCVW